MKFVLFFLCFLFYFPAFCQNEQLLEQRQQEFVHSIGFNIGVNDFHIRDEYLSPYIFAGTMFSSRLLYQLETERYHHTLDIFYSNGHPSSDIQPRDVTEKIGSFSYSITRKLDVEHIAGNPLELSLGAGVSTFAAFANFNAIDKISKYTFYDWSWYLSHSLNLLFRSEYRMKDQNSFSVQFTMPVFRLVSRPENGHFFNEDNETINKNFMNAVVHGRSEFFWHNLVLIGEVGYTQPLRSRFNLRVDYRFNYISSDRPLSMEMYMNHFLIGLDWLF